MLYYTQQTPNNGTLVKNKESLKSLYFFNAVLNTVMLTQVLVSLFCFTQSCQSPIINHVMTHKHLKHFPWCSVFYYIDANYVRAADCTSPNSHLLYEWFHWFLYYRGLCFHISYWIGFVSTDTGGKLFVKALSQVIGITTVLDLTQRFPRLRIIDLPPTPTPIAFFF